MKKAITIIILAIVLGSCVTTHKKCPAYGSINKKSVVTRHFSQKQKNKRIIIETK
ncbi:MAG: hypothetical protein WCH65_01880 [bacterium]